jgi:hypothetical protein
LACAGNRTLYRVGAPLSPKFHWPRNPVSHIPLSMEELIQASADIILCPASTISIVADTVKKNDQIFSRVD